MQAFALHHRVRGVRMAQLMQPRVRHDPGGIAGRGPEVVEFVRAQRPVSLGARETLGPRTPLPARRFGSSCATLPSRTCLGLVLVSLRVKRSGLTSHQRRRRISPGLHPISKGRHTAATNTRFSSSHRAGPRRASLDRPHRAAARVADGARAQVPGGSGTMAPQNGTVEHVA